MTGFTQYLNTIPYPLIPVVIYRVNMLCKKNFLQNLTVIHRTFHKSTFLKLGFPEAPVLEIIKCFVLPKVWSYGDRKKSFPFSPIDLIFHKSCQDSLPLLHIKSSHTLTLQPPINFSSCCLFSTRLFMDKLRIWNTMLFSPFLPALVLTRLPW